MQDGVSVRGSYRDASPAASYGDGEFERPSGSELHGPCGYPGMGHLRRTGAHESWVPGDGNFRRYVAPTCCLVCRWLCHSEPWSSSSDMGTKRGERTRFIR